MQFCDEMNVIPLLHGKTVSKPCANNFPHRHIRNGKPTTRDFVIARPLTLAAAHEKPQPEIKE